jgi:hypothetical protein
MSTPTRRRQLAVASLALALTVGAAACGDDGDDEAQPVDAAEQAGGDQDGGLGAQAGLPAAACQAYADFSAGIAGDPSTLGGTLEELQAALPETLTADGTAVVQAFDAQGPEALGSPDFNEPMSAIGAAVWDGCTSDAQLDVTGVDYAFQDLPEQVGAGQVAIRFTNGSEAEPHEMVLMRRNDGVTAGAEELLSLPEEQVMSQVTMAGVVFADPGASQVLLADLEPGSYIAICMIPTGGAEDGAPHAMHGMVADLEVS